MSTGVLNKMVQDLNMDLLRMGLDDDQEDYLLKRIDSAIEEAATQIDASEDIRKTFSINLPQLQDIINQQKELVQAYNASHTTAPRMEQETHVGEVELF